MQLFIMAFSLIIQRLMQILFMLKLTTIMIIIVVISTIIQIIFLIGFGFLAKNLLYIY